MWLLLAKRREAAAGKPAGQPRADPNRICLSAAAIDVERAMTFARQPAARVVLMTRDAGAEWCRSRRRRFNYHRRHYAIAPRSVFWGASSMIGFLLRAAISALGLWIASEVLSGLSFDSTAQLIVAALLLGVVNAVVRPLAFILTLPLTVVTLGLFLLVLNAGMLALVAWIVPGFHISGFWTAVGAALILSLVSWVASSAIGSKGKVEVFISRR